jgi:hypothetical protein
VYTFNPPLKNPPLKEPGVPQYQGSFEGRHPPLETPPKETRKRQPTPTTISEARERLGEWEGSRRSRSCAAGVRR